MSGFPYHHGLARIGANVATAGIRIAALGLAQISNSRWLRVAGLLIMLMIAGAGWDQTQARSPGNGPPQRVIHGPNYHPPYAAIVIDDKSGFVLHEVSADEPRHPASLTKIMTLYLLFEQLEYGNAQARHAAAGLDPGGDAESDEAWAQGQSDHQRR
jgi:D-alanyl-D-alanine carboxypeptidase